MSVRKRTNLSIWFELAGISQKDLLESLQDRGLTITKGTISKIFAGTMKSVSEEVAYAISEVLEEDVCTFFEPRIDQPRYTVR